MQVLFIDFGNREIVERSDLVKCVVLPEIPELALAVKCSNPGEVSESTIHKYNNTVYSLFQILLDSRYSITLKESGSSPPHAFVEPLPL